MRNDTDATQRLLRLIGSEREDHEPAGPRPAAQTLPSEADILDAYSQAVVDVVERISPAVVRIGGEARGGMGSGFLITPDGYALTNSHVVDGRHRLSATTSEGDRLDARVIGDDPATDLALVRLAAADLPYA
ncbi:MAG: trypsin-like peptidase domain-containing protein, partial [Planctomycetaceae bacterium]